jgi:hypothetical protein
MAAIQGFVASSGEGAGACERGSRRKGLSAHDVDGDDAVAGHGGNSSTGSECGQGSFGPVEANDDG